MIRPAQEKDIDRINELLFQIHKVHADKRPDIFKPNRKKYDSDEIMSMLHSDEMKIFCFVDEDDVVQAYAFCKIMHPKESNNMQGLKRLYIDDICVDETQRRKGIGRTLYQYVKEYAKSIDCYHILLNVWALNDDARKFYESLGMKPLKTDMEEIL